MIVHIYIVEKLNITRWLRTGSNPPDIYQFSNEYVKNIYLLYNILFLTYIVELLMDTIILGDKLKSIFKK